MAEGTWVLNLVAKKKLFVILYGFDFFTHMTILRMKIECHSINIFKL